jgi:hypothetical protein
MKARTRTTARDVAFEYQVRDVDNPYYAPEHPVSKSNPRKISATINVRESTVEALYARGLIDDAQRRAADRFRALWEDLGGSGAGAMDYAREVVDGGKGRDPITDRQLSAGMDMKRASDALKAAHGEYAVRLVGYICGNGHSINALAETRRQRSTMTDNLRSYLDALAVHWNYSTRKTLR